MGLLEKTWSSIVRDIRDLLVYGVFVINLTEPNVVDLQWMVGSVFKIINKRPECAQFEQHSTTALKNLDHGKHEDITKNHHDVWFRDVTTCDAYFYHTVSYGREMPSEVLSK